MLKRLAKTDSWYLGIGGMAEWLMAAALKVVEGASSPWVQILLPPPVLNMITERWPSWLKALAC